MRVCVRPVVDSVPGFPAAPEKSAVSGGGRERGPSPQVTAARRRAKFCRLGPYVEPVQLYNPTRGGGGAFIDATRRFQGRKPVETPPSARRARHDGGRVPLPRTRVVLPDHAPPRIKPGISSPRTVRAARERLIDHKARASRKPGEMSGGRLDARTLKDEVASMDKGWLLDLGHPLLNRVADSFIRAAGVRSLCPCRVLNWFLLLTPFLDDTKGRGGPSGVAGGLLRHRRR